MLNPKLGMTYFFIETTCYTSLAIPRSTNNQIKSADQNLTAEEAAVYDVIPPKQ